MVTYAIVYPFALTEHFVICVWKVEVNKHSSLQITKHESTYSLTSIASGSSYGNPVLPHVEEPLERKEVIGITGDVQKFVAAISELRKAMEEADDAIEEDGKFFGKCIYMYMALFTTYM